MNAAIAEQNAGATAPAPKIELKKVKLCEFMSEETQCYECEVWIDGILSFTASNEGHGGCDNYQPVYDRAKDKYRHEEYNAGMAKLTAYCATLPPLPASDWKGAEPLPMTVELLIGDLIEKYSNAKKVEKTVKQLRDRVMFIKDGAIHSYKRVLPALVSQQLVYAKKHHPGCVMLNECTTEQARALIEKHLFVK